MTKLEKDYNNAVTAYIKKFEQIHDVYFEFWVGDHIGEIASIGDECFNFADIKYVVDNNISHDYLIDWYYFTMENRFINLNAYCKLRNDAEKDINFNLSSFEKLLLNM